MCLSFPLRNIQSFQLFDEIEVRIFGHSWPVGHAGRGNEKDFRRSRNFNKERQSRVVPNATSYVLSNNPVRTNGITKS